MKKFIVGLYHIVTKQNIGSLAATISFFTFSALIPIVLLLIYGASLLIPVAAVERFVTDTLRSYIPVLPGEGAFVSQTVLRLTTLKTGISIVSILGLIWTSVGGFVSLQQILDTILGSHIRRSFIKQYIIGFLMMGFLLSLTVISSLITAISPRFLSKMTSSHAIVWLNMTHLFGEVSFPVILFVTCYCCYRFLPSRILSILALTIGATFSTVSIYASRFLFVLYTQHLGNYHLIYGTLTVVMLFIFWIYIVSMIFLIGSAIATSIENVRNRSRILREAEHP